MEDNFPKNEFCYSDCRIARAELLHFSTATLRQSESVSAIEYANSFGDIFAKREIFFEGFSMYILTTHNPYDTLRLGL